MRQNFDEVHLYECPVQKKTMKYYSFASGVMATPECEKSFHNSIFTAEMYFVDKC